MEGLTFAKSNGRIFTTAPKHYKQTKLIVNIVCYEFVQHECLGKECLGKNCFFDDKSKY